MRWPYFPFETTAEGNTPIHYKFIILLIIFCLLVVLTFSLFLQEIVIQLLKDAMLQHPDSPGFLIDGFPRETAQGEQFEKEAMTVDCYFFLFVCLFVFALLTSISRLAGGGVSFHSVL